PSAVAIAVSQALFRTLKGRRLQLLGHLCVEYLVYHTLQQLSHTLVSTKKLVQSLAIYGNLVLGHPLQPPVGFVDQLNHYQEGDGPSYCYAILILEFTPSYRTLLLSEDGPFWTAFLRSLGQRGLRGVQLVISDAH